MSPPEEIRAAIWRFRRRRVRRWGAQRAAMAVIVSAVAGGGPAVLLTRRADSVGTNPGQLALPTVRTDRWESAVTAARGRLAESLGIHLPPEGVLGRLDDYATHASLVITPVVLWAGPLGTQRVAATDVVAVPLTDLDVEPVFVANAESDTIRLPLHGEWLNAPTAAILHQFRELVLYHRPTRVAHLAPTPHSAGSAG